MPATDAIQVTVCPEAATFVAELGLTAEMQQMIDHVRTTIPGLWRIKVALQPPYDTGDEDQVIVWCTCEPTPVHQNYEMGRHFNQ